MDDEGKPVDLLHLQTNPAYELHTGLRNVAGKRALEIAPDFDGMWFDFYGNVARTGEAARTEYYVAAPVDRWFTLHASRVGGEGSRKIAVVFNDITGRKRAEEILRESEERQAFLLKLSDALRAEPDADAVANLAVRMLAEELGLDRCYATAMYPAEDRVDVIQEYRRPDLAPMPTPLHFSDFPEAGRRSFDRTLIFNDTANDPDLTDADKRSLAAMSFGALLSSPVRRRTGNPIWALGAVSSQPRHWTAAEIALVEETAERTWAAVERARAEERLRESERRLAAELSGTQLLQRLSTRLIPEQSPEALYEEILDTALELMRADAVSIQLLEDDGKRLRRVATRNLHPASTEYWTWVDASHASTCGQALGKNQRVVLEDVEAAPELAGTGDLEAFRASGTRAVQSSPLLTRTGRPIGMISTHWRAPRRFDESDFSLFDILARQVADLLERSQAEATLRESQERQAFLLELSDALRAEPDADAVAERAIRMLSEQLRLDRCYIASYRLADDRADISHQAGNDEVPALPDTIRLSDFPAAFRQVFDRTLVIDDVAETAGLSEADRRNIEALGLRALIAPTLRMGENSPLWVIVAVSARPRRWTPGEIALAEEATERTWAAMERARAEERLRESEVRYRSLIGATNQVLYRHNPDWSEMRQLTGGGFLEDTNSPDPGWFSRYILPEDQPYIWAAIQEAIRKKSIFELEHRVIRADGTVGWTLSRSIPVFGDNGEIVEWFGAASDVSARREMEEALRESESRYRILFEATGTPYLVLAADAPRFTITDVNGAYLDVTMTRREALLGRGVFEAFPENPDDPGGVGVRDLKASLERVLDSGHPDTLPVLKYDIRRPDGTFEERYWIAHNTPIFDGASTAAGIVHRAEDVTGYVRLRARGAELSEKTERLESEIVAAGQRLQQTNERLRESEARLRKEAAGARSLHLVSSLLIREEDVGALYSRIVDAAAVLMHSNAASIQIVSGNGDSLQLLAWKGFHPEAAAFWKTVTPGSESSCGVALRQGKRIVVPDAENCAFLAGTEDLKYYRISNIRAVQSTPLLSRTGRMLGMISTHWREPHEPTEDELRLFDVLARQAADLIERGRAEWRLRESEARQRQILNSATDYAIIAMDLAGRVTLWNEGAQNVLGWSEGEMLGQTIEPIFTSEDVAAGTAEQEMRDALARGHGGDDRWQVRKSGERFWANGEVTPLAAENGETIGFVKVLRDRTQERRAEEHQELLINELNHRVKNTLVTVQSFAGQTLRNTERSADARALLESRLTALARAHDVLTRESWKGADVRNIVNRALDPFRTPQRKMVVEGPEARLSPRQALALSMALHELATNAVKYGALSGADGTIQVTWTVAANNGAGELDLTWREQDGPRVVPPKRKGFGSRLIERNLSRELGGEAKIEYRPDGIVANIKAPLEFGGGGEFHNPTR